MCIWCKIVKIGALCSGKVSGIKKMKYEGTGKHVLMTYCCRDGSFRYTKDDELFLQNHQDTRPFWQIMREEGMASEKSAVHFQSQLEKMAASNSPIVEFEEYFLKNSNRKWGWYRVGYVCPIPGTDIYITFTEMEKEKESVSNRAHVSQYDSLTGLPSYDTFVKSVEMMMDKDEAGIIDGEYALVFFDVIRFKAINDIFGMEAGDRLLKFIANALLEEADSGDVVCRQGADRFLIFTHTVGEEMEASMNRLFGMLPQFDLPFEITCNVGIYVTREKRLSVEQMIDRAVLAQSTIKGSYTTRYEYYTEDMRKDMLGEQEITGMMGNALTEKHFVVYYQPQYNHGTGAMTGAEALVRWNHPERGLISPGVFIPIFEKNGFITKLDMYVFEEVCVFLHRCRKNGWALFPISVNFSRQDIFQNDFVEKLEVIRKKYDVPVKYLCVEITESAIMGNSQYANEVVNKLHQFGYIVEMDDFGSGYSSLNVLKDIDLDVIKLDMLFLDESDEKVRGGTILSSVVRMAKWLGMPIIAEGVETIEQADFLKSIGCENIQGYLYSRPLPQQNYEELLNGDQRKNIIQDMDLTEKLNVADFWNPTSQETLIFSNYVGGAAIFDYCNGKAELLRVNKKYQQEICMNMSEKELIEMDPLETLDDESRQIYGNMLEQAIKTGEEQECITWRNFKSYGCGAERMCIRSNVRVIGKTGDNYLFYAMIRNITTEMKQYVEMMDTEKRFKMASE